MVQLMTSNLAAGESMTLTTINDFQRHAQTLHCAGAPQGVRRPCTIFPTTENKRVVVPPVLHRLARLAVPTLLEDGLTVADLLAHRLYANMTFLVPGCKAPFRMSCHFLQLTKLVQLETRQ